MEKLTTLGSDIASTIRASTHKQGSRNLIENYKNGRGYEGGGGRNGKYDKN